MTREEARKAAEVMLAYADGKEIECTAKGMDIWKKSDRPIFNWCRYKYRVKPRSEKFDPNTLQPFDKVLVRDSDEELWSCTLFSHIVNESEYMYRCMWIVYKMAIPYNDDTKHLLGTYDDAPEFYRYWEE